MIINEKLFDDFDFSRIKNQISNLASSEESALAVQNRVPFSSAEETETYKKAGREWISYLTVFQDRAIEPWPQVSDLFDILKVENTVLHREQLFALGLFSSSVEKLRKNITNASVKIKIPLLLNQAEKMPSLLDAGNLIFNVIDKNGELKDLPSIRELRNKIAALKREALASIRKYTSDPALQNALQSTVPAYRASRELIAVKAAHKNAIDGIIHEASASLQTVYIEPQETVRINNEIISKEAELEAETIRIFRELTEQLSPYRTDFEKCFEKMIFLDSTLQAARWGHKINGAFCRECSGPDEAPLIIQARHPVLGEKAVPIDIKFSQGKRILMITGANAGGKTVTMKTFALCVLLNQAGFPVPCAEGTRLPFFNSLFADIGDDQSLDEDLSTFSSRMKKMAYILEHADENSLVLLDEAASGTDPSEGSALAMASLDELIQKKSFVIATTHHGVLKNYAFTHKECVNASVEFDADTLKPSYKLVMGVPGESHAISLAANAGLPQKIIERAKDYISGNNTDVSTLIQGLEEKHRELDELIRGERIRNSELEVKFHKLHEKETKLSERELSLKIKEHEESSDFVKNTRSLLENLVRELREGEITREKTLRVKNFLDEISGEAQAQVDYINRKSSEIEEEKESLKEEEKILLNGIRLSKQRGKNSKSSKKTKARASNAEALSSALPSSIQSEAASKKEDAKKQKAVSVKLFESGKKVFAGKNRLEGTLIEKTKKGWLVQLGSLKMTFSESQLVPAESQNVNAGGSFIFEKSGSTFTSDERPVFELRLLGLRYEEAMKALEKQLDLCAIHNLRNFSVIHGKGTGVLQQGVHDYLSNCPLVKDFHFARAEDGGFGKTYIELY